MMEVRKTIEVVTNIAILAVCVLLGWTLITHKGLHFGSSGVGDEEAKLVGQSVPALPGYNWSNHPKTLVLAIRKGCHFCESSLPFYKHLGELEQSKALHAHVLAVMPDPQADGVTDLKAGGVTVDGVFNQPLDSMKVSGTPTLLLLDANGRVAQAWVGELSEKREKDLIAALEK